MERTTNKGTTRRNIKSRRENTTFSKNNIRDLILNQSITSGIIIAAVLLLTLTNTELTTSLKLKLKNVIGKTTTIEELKSSSNYFTNIFTSVKTIFGGQEKKSEVEKKEEDIPIEKETNVSGDRIDLDVLEQLKKGQEISYEKKPVVPE